MLRVIAFGLAAGAGFQAWRQFPADGPQTTRSLWVVFLVGLVCAFLGGLWRRRASASAWASARAEANASAAASSTATQTVNVAVVMPGAGAGSQAGRVATESMPWIVDASSRSASLDDFEGMDVAEILESSEVER